jgi:hypothetical protein
MTDYLCDLKTDPPQEILTSVSLYYLTDTFPRCIYPYRGVSPAVPNNTKIQIPQCN